jgi:hypothetical protein
MQASADDSMCAFGEELYLKYGYRFHLSYDLFVNVHISLCLSMSKAIINSQ